MGRLRGFIKLRPGPAVGKVFYDGMGMGMEGVEGWGERRRGRGFSLMTGTLGRGRHEPPWHVYDLRRGRTSAVCRGGGNVLMMGDGFAFATGRGKRTVHVFPVNPYGGQTESEESFGGEGEECQ